MGYCERCGGRFDFEGLCEICGDDEEWSWNTPHNPNKVKCAKCGTEIYETRRYCHVCGAKNPAADKKGSAYCPECGIAFENGICPECGRTQNDFRLRSIEPKYKTRCSSCRKEISSRDRFCMHCGEENFKVYPGQRDEKDYSNSQSNSKPKSTSYREAESESYTVGDAQYAVEHTNSTLWTILGLIQAILFCMPTGLLTVLYSFQATNCAKIAKLERAQKKLKTAKAWFIAGIIIDLIILIAFAAIKLLPMIFAK
ncbi:MAG: zinc-ribbon domain-containing protein [Oscillospiraceae bacterium]|nr:zinc-ribbon domain-containing protein [Oscillospiraceae bacterium]